jgi:hypothetical protein
MGQWRKNDEIRNEHMNGSFVVLFSSKTKMLQIKEKREQATPIERLFLPSTSEKNRWNNRPSGMNAVLSCR